MGESDKFILKRNNGRITSFSIGSIEYQFINTIIDNYKLSSVDLFEIDFSDNGFYYDLGMNCLSGMNKGIYFSVEYDRKRPDVVKVSGDILQNSWDHKYGFSEYMLRLNESLKRRIISNKDIEIIRLSRTDEDWGGEGAVGYEFNIILNKNLNTSHVFNVVQEILEELRNDIMGFYNRKYLTSGSYNNEKVFTLEVLLPLFRLMRFVDVKYNHGVREFGKDITFSEYDLFGIRRNYGVQVKIGDLSGESLSELEKIIAQIDDAFSMPYYDENEKTKRYISFLVIAISGRYIGNAKDKIIEKSKNRSVIFLCLDKIQELFDKYVQDF